MAKKTVTFTGTLADADAILTSVATDDQDETVYEGVDLDGVIGADEMTIPRTLTVTAGDHAGAYNITDPIVIVGLDSEGHEITEEFHLTDADGDETIVGTLGFAQVTSITFPQQADDDGTIEVGVRDIICAANPPKEIRPGSTGNLHLGYEEGAEDTITGIIAGEHFEISPHKIFGDGGTTITSFILFF